MKKSHMILLLITAVMALFSAYSLAAINQVYNIDFEWYSQYNNNFSSELRQTNRDSWHLSTYPQSLEYMVINNIRGLNEIKQGTSLNNKIVDSTDFSKYVMIYCTLGNVVSPEYRIKVIGIAQRGNVVEVKLSVNSPAKSVYPSVGESNNYSPEDIIKVRKDMFPVKGKLYFIFKNQNGTQLGEKYYYI